MRWEEEGEGEGEEEMTGKVGGVRGGVEQSEL